MFAEPSRYSQSCSFSGLFFMPIASLSGDNPGVMTLGDLNGVVGSLIVAWVYTRYSRQSIWYLLPMLIWMPITFALKMFYWHANLYKLREEKRRREL